MSLDIFYKLNPYNDDQLEKLSLFEKENNISGIVESINKIRSISKEEYLQNKKESNDIEEIYYVERDNKITDCCFIQGEKDRKVCKISWYDIKKPRHNLPFVAADYAFYSLGMEEVFIELDPSDKHTKMHLEIKGFECLGEEDGKLIYLKDREEKEKNQRMI